MPAISGGRAPNLTPPPGNPRFPLLDSLRAIAALCVFAGHTVTGTYGLTTHRSLFVLATQLAYEGVAIFFLISGFLLYRPFLVARRAARPFSLVRFAQRRILRIVPAYWVALSIFLALGVVNGVTSGNWWIFYGFGQNYRFNTIGNGIGVAWTLCIEVTFYAALPIFSLAAARLSTATAPLRGDVILLAALGTGALAFRAHDGAFQSLATVSTLPGFFFWFALGMGLAVASVTERGRSAAGAVRVRYWSTLSWLLAVAGFILLHELPHAVGALGATEVDVATHALYGIVALLMLLPAFFEADRDSVVRRVLRRPVLAWIGLVSYAFYLYHTIVIAQLNEFAASHGIALRYPLVTVGALVVSLGCAAASFYLLERPLMRLGVRPRARP
ncbi:MAG: acyltransferase family protein [Solirubrobacteraceae bacterium]